MFDPTHTHTKNNGKLQQMTHFSKSVLRKWLSSEALLNSLPEQIVQQTRRQPYSYLLP